jgi:hypothetical protein
MDNKNKNKSKKEVYRIRLIGERGMSGDGMEEVEKKVGQ